MVSGQEMLLVAVDPSALGTFVQGGGAASSPGIPVISICAVPGTANCADVSSIRVMSEAPQVTTGVTPLALAVQYCNEMGIVKMLLETMGSPCVCPGGIKNICVELSRFWAFR